MIVHAHKENYKLAEIFSYLYRETFLQIYIYIYIYMRIYIYISFVFLYIKKPSYEIALDSI